jgi:hypothetical protein
MAASCNLVEFTNISEVLMAFIKRAITLVIEAVSTFEPSINFYHITRQNSYLRTLHCENLKSHVSEVMATDWTTGRSRFDPRQRRKYFSSSLCSD